MVSGGGWGVEGVLIQKQNCPCHQFEFDMHPFSVFVKKQNKKTSESSSTVHMQLMTQQRLFEILKHIMFHFSFQQTLCTA